MSRRVVVTGVGLVSPLGIGTEPTWAGATSGTSGVSTITRIDTSDYPVHIGAEVKGFDPEKWIEAKEVKKYDLFVHFALAATTMALESSGLEINEENATRVGVVIGSGIGGFPLIERQHEILLNRGPKRVSPFFIPGAIINMCSGLISIRTGAKGPNMATCTACSTSAHAIGDALLYIRHGYADAIIAGGSEAVTSGMPLAGFSSMRALSTRVAAMGQGPRRVCDRRGVGDRHPRGARAREAARSADSRRSSRFWDEFGCLSYFGPGRRR
jgi:3-oxoacyl-[acyl-carrier-protein] synthase II